MDTPERKLTPFEARLLSNVQTAISRKWKRIHAMEQKVEEAREALEAALTRLHSNPRYHERLELARDPERMQMLKADPAKWAEWVREGDQLERPPSPPTSGACGSGT